MSTTLELLIKARSEFDAAFRQLQTQLEGTKGQTQQLASVFDQFKARFPELATAGAAMGAGFAAATTAISGVKSAIAGTIEAVVALSARAEQIQNRAAITGWSVDTVQMLDRVAEAAGLSGEVVEQAMMRLQRGAVEGSRGFEKLGISTREFLRLDPAEQLRQAAEAIMSQATAAERSALAQELFGRSGAQLIPILAQIAQGIDTVSVGMSDQQVTAIGQLDNSLDALEGGWTDLKQQLVAIVAQSPEVRGAIVDIARVLVELAVIIRTIGPTLTQTFEAMARGITTSLAPGLWEVAHGLTALFETNPAQVSGQNSFFKKLSDGMMSADQASRLLNQQLRESERDTRQLEEATRRAAAAEAVHVRELDKAEKSAEDDAKALLDVENAEIAEQKAAEDAITALEALAEKQDMVAESAAELATSNDAEQAFRDEQLAAEEARGALEAHNQAMGEYASLAGNIAQALDQMNARQGTLIHYLAEAAHGFEEGARAAEQYAQAQTDAGRASAGLSALSSAYESGSPVSGATTGAVFGASVGGPIGGLIGGVVGGIAGLFGGQSQREQILRQIRDMRDEFVNASGGLNLLQARAQAAGVSLKAMWDAQTVEEYEYELANVQKALAGQERAQQAVLDAMERYGLTIDQMGPRFAQQHLDEQAAQLLRDYQLLTAAGADANVVLGGMADAINAYVQAAIASGTTVPEAMRPILEAMVRNGQLLDANGNAYTSLEEAGVTFAETMTEQFADLMDSIQDLVNAILGVGGAWDKAGEGVDRYSEKASKVPHPPGTEPPPAEEPPPEFARGGIVLPFIPRAATGIVAARPGGTPVIVGEGGEPELVAPVRAIADRIASTAAKAAGGGTIHVHVHLDGKEIGETLVRRRSAGLPA